MYIHYDRAKIRHISKSVIVRYIKRSLLPPDIRGFWRRDIVLQERSTSEFLTQAIAAKQSSNPETLTHTNHHIDTTFPMHARGREAAQPEFNSKSVTKPLNSYLFFKTHRPELCHLMLILRILNPTSQRKPWLWKPNYIGIIFSFLLQSRNVVITFRMEFVTLPKRVSGASNTDTHTLHVLMQFDGVQISWLFSMLSQPSAWIWDANWSRCQQYDMPRCVLRPRLERCSGMLYGRWSVERIEFPIFSIFACMGVGGMISMNCHEICLASSTHTPFK